MGVSWNIKPRMSGKKRQVNTSLAHDSTLHQPFPPTVDPPNLPAWKRLISHPPAQSERAPLITAIFADNNEVEMVRNLCGDDAQTFVDLVDEVRLCSLSPLKHGLVDLQSEFYPLSVRCWIVSHRNFARDVHALYTGFAAAKPYFRNRWQSRFVIIQRKAPCAMAGSRTYGRVSIKAGRSRPRF